METWSEADDELLTEAAWFANQDRIAKPAIGQEDRASLTAGRIDPAWFECEGSSPPLPRPTELLAGERWHTPHDSSVAQTIEVLQRVAVFILMLGHTRSNITDERCCSGPRHEEHICAVGSPQRRTGHPSCQRHVRSAFKRQEAEASTPPSRPPHLQERGAVCRRLSPGWPSL